MLPRFDYNYLFNSRHLEGIKVEWMNLVNEEKLRPGVLGEWEAPPQIAAHIVNPIGHSKRWTSEAFCELSSEEMCRSCRQLSLRENWSTPCDLLDAYIHRDSNRLTHRLAVGHVLWRFDGSISITKLITAQWGPDLLVRWYITSRFSRHMQCTNDGNA